MSMTVKQLKHWLEDKLNTNEIAEDSEILVSCYEEIYIQNTNGDCVDLPKFYAPN